MDLTEPDAGSDLGAVMLKATWSEEKQTWLLNGVKRFITNGDGDVSLVLARTEEGTTDARGLSMLVYDKRDGGVKVRRIENKTGYQGIADVRAGLHQRSGATGRRPQDGPYQIRDVADERRPSGHRRPVGGSLRGRLPRSPQIRPRARAVRQADHPLRRRFGDALQHESQIAGRPRAVVRNHALRRGLQAVRPYRARTFARRRRSVRR